ncbi:hypothetical protein [Pseudomonas sp. DWP3-1-2]|uniref:hypothetical protein n=1 Tax=Pseudomonas sp. DWP3-1-2 TaxID=2804645 RepID=UPI003CF663A1
MRFLKCISHLTILFGFGLRLVSSLFVLVVSLISTSSYAAYVWNGSYPSAQAACTGTAAANIYPPAISVVSATLEGMLETSGYCRVINETQTGSTSTWGFGLSRSGTEDPVDPPNKKCQDAKGASTKYNWKSNSDAPATTVSINGCAASISGFAICLTSISGGYNCSGIATITGDLLEADGKGNASECEGSACTDPVPQKESSESPCQAISSGSGFSCTATKEESNPGQTKCGTANGAWVCTDSPKATSTKSVSDINQSSTSNSDGSTTTKTTTTTTTTSCSGIGNCTTGTTTTVVTGGTNSNGTTKPSSSTCSGPECNGGTVNAGTGSGSGDSGSGDGDDEQCEGEECEEEDKGEVSGDMQCESTVACSGDVIQCAVLRQEQTSRCADKEFRDVTDKKVADLKSKLTTEFSGSDYQPIKASADTTFDLSNMIDTSSKFSSSCPRLQTISYTWVDGSGHSFDPNVDGLCTFLTYMGYLMVAFAMRRAAEIIATGIV